MNQDRAPKLIGELKKVGHVTVRYENPGDAASTYQLDEDVYTFDGFNVQSGDPEDPYVTFIKVTPKTVLSDESAVYDIINDDGEITDRVVIIDFTY